MLQLYPKIPYRFLAKSVYSIGGLLGVVFRRRSNGEAGETFVLLFIQLR